MHIYQLGKNFVQTNDVEVHTIGVNKSGGLDDLEAVGNAANNPIPTIYADDISDLADIVENLTSVVTVSGTLMDNVDFDSDGDFSDSGALVSIEIDGTVHAVADGNIDLTTAEGGRFIFDFTTGDYSYTINPHNSVDGLVNEDFKVIAEDGNGAQTEFSMKIDGEQCSVVEGKTIYGDNSNNTIEGTDGDDTIFAGRGQDTIDAGDGDDKIVIEGGIRYNENDHDTIDGGDGHDTLEIRDKESISFDNIDNIEVIDLSDSDKKLDISLDDVFSITDSNHKLAITGSDLENLDVDTEGWEQEGDAKYDEDSNTTEFTYSNEDSTVTLTVDDQIDEL